MNTGKPGHEAARLLGDATEPIEPPGSALAAIDQHVVDGGINLWEKPSTDQRV